jgi:hypothetical protein
LARRLGRISQAPGIELGKLLRKIVGPDSARVSRQMEAPFLSNRRLVFNIWRLLITANLIALLSYFTISSSVVCTISDLFRDIALLSYFTIPFSVVCTYSGFGSQCPFLRVPPFVYRTALVDCNSSEAQSLCSQEILS